MERTLHFPVIDANNHSFKTPTRGILGQEDMRRWLISDGVSTLMDFIMALNASVSKKKVSEAEPPSPAIQRILGVLEEMDGWIKEIPPQQQAQRFGNKAFREWYGRLQQNGARLNEQVLQGHSPNALTEITPYLVEGFGNSTRIDYGTGHEMSFAAWLCCLHLIRLVQEEDFPNLVFRVFQRYLTVVRNLQRTYMMEPAGSHGVWGLDDFQFLPFLWGSAQFIDHPFVKPKAILSVDMIESLEKDYIFMGCIQFIREMKKGPFAEHSPVLYDISAVPLWAKVNVGLHKMYAAEVLVKFPVVQHFLFGSLLTLNPAADLNPFLQPFVAK